MNAVIVAASFDDLRAPDMRLLHEASRAGAVHVLLPTDESAAAWDGRPPKFPLAERHYFVESIRYVDRVTVVNDLHVALSEARAEAGEPIVVAANRSSDAAVAAECDGLALEFHAIPAGQLAGFPEQDDSAGDAQTNARPRVIVTGCYDWFHTGHVRFFEECAEHGELHVVVGHDANIEHLKGAGHPMFPEDQRRYMVDAIRFVRRAYVSTGHGWLDAEPEIALIQPDIYLVNEDGDKPEKREFCASRGIEYRVLTRKPKEGLPARQSTDLRGF